MLCSICFWFGSFFSTTDDNTITGLKIDNIQVTDGSGNIVFSDNADDEVNGSNEWIRVCRSSIFMIMVILLDQVH